MKRDEAFLNSKDLRKFDLAEGDTVVQNFFLKKAPVCRYAPEINFAFNSFKIVHENSNPSYDEDSLSFLINIMNDNSNIVVEIAGHCDSREKSDLALKRAQYVVAELIKKGISPKRLTSKGYGSKQPVFPVSFISKAKSKEEKEALHQKNRRATFKVLTFDYKPE